MNGEKTYRSHLDTGSHSAGEKVLNVMELHISRSCKASKSVQNAGSHIEISDTKLYKN